jgi:hypothetical protein
MGFPSDPFEVLMKVDYPSELDGLLGTNARICFASDIWSGEGRYTTYFFESGQNVGSGIKADFMDLRNIRGTLKRLENGENGNWAFIESAPGSLRAIGEKVHGLLLIRGSFGVRFMEDPHLKIPDSRDPVSVYAECESVYKCGIEEVGL